MPPLVHHAAYCSFVVLTAQRSLIFWAKNEISKPVYMAVCRKNSPHIRIDINHLLQNRYAEQLEIVIYVNQNLVDPHIWVEF